jgi:hypothetical protein
LVTAGAGGMFSCALVRAMHRELARGAALVTGLGGFLAQLVLADAGDFVVRGVQLLVGDDHDRRIVACFDLAQRAALLVEQEVGDFHRHLHQHLAGVVLHRMLFGHADDRQRQRFDAAHAAMALAARADDLAGFAQLRDAGAGGHFQQAEAEMRPICTRARSYLSAFCRLVLDFALVLAGFMSMKSITTRPPRSRRRNWRATSSAASRLVLNAVSSMSPPLVARAELTSIAPALRSGRSRSSRRRAGARCARRRFDLRLSIWKRLNSGRCRRCTA